MRGMRDANLVSACNRFEIHADAVPSISIFSCSQRPFDVAERLERRQDGVL